MRSIVRLLVLSQHFRSNGRESCNDRQQYIPSRQSFFCLSYAKSNRVRRNISFAGSTARSFLFRLQIGYPSFDDELLLLLDKFEKVLDNLNEVLNSYEIEEIKTNVANVFVSPEVASYALQLVSATRSHAAIQLGISPRGSLSFIQAAKAYALIHGRNYVTPKDLQDLVPYVFSHRLIFYDRSLKEDEKKQIIHTLVAQIPIPVR